MVELNKLPDGEMQVLDKRFRRAMVDCYRLFGERAFRKQKRGSPRRYPINRALFEVWSANVEALSAGDVDRLQAKKDDLRERFLEVLDDSSFAAARRMNNFIIVFLWTRLNCPRGFLPKRGGPAGDLPQEDRLAPLS